MKRNFLLLLASIGAIAIFLQATATGNTSTFARYFDTLLGFNLVVLAGLSILVGLAVLVIPIVELVKACQRAADRKKYCKVK